VDVERQEVRFGDRVIKTTIPDGPPQPARRRDVGPDGGAVGSGHRHRDDGDEAAVCGVAWLLIGG